MNTSSRENGLTLLEVIIAVAVLAIGVLAAAQMQAAGLRFTAQAEAINQVTRVARGELEVQRHSASILDLSGEVPADDVMPDPVDEVVRACDSFLPDGIERCEVTIRPCGLARLDSDGDGSVDDEPFVMMCGSGVISPPAFEVQVEVEGRRNASIALRTLSTGVFIGGGGQD